MTNNEFHMLYLYKNNICLSNFETSTLVSDTEGLKIYLMIQPLCNDLGLGSRNNTSAALRYISNEYLKSPQKAVHTKSVADISINGGKHD